MRIKRPRPLPELTKLHTADTLVKHFNYKKVRLECTVSGCTVATCKHPGRRYHLRGATLLPVSGLAIVTQNYFNLDLAERMPDDTWSIFARHLEAEIVKTFPVILDSSQSLYRSLPLGHSPLEKR